MLMLDAEYMTVAEIAELFKLNQQTVRNWIDSGRLPAVRIGSRRVRVRRSDLENFVAAHSSIVDPGVGAREDGPGAERADVDLPPTSSGPAEHRPAEGPAWDADKVAAALRALGDAVNALADALDGR